MTDPLGPAPRIHRRNYALFALLPVALLAASFIRSPWLFAVERFVTDVPALPSKPVALYRNQGLRVYYTSEDLLHPEAFGAPGEYLQAVVFDIFPAGEGNSTDVGRLTWIRQIGRALLLLDPMGRPLNAPVHPGDRTLAMRFLTTFSGPPRLERGAIEIFPLPPSSGYRSRSGIRAVVALAVKPAWQDSGAGMKGIATQHAVALERAFRAVARDASGVGVPSMPLPDRLGQGVTHEESWRRLLDLIDRVGPDSGLRIVVLGGSGLEPASREHTDQSFRQTWRDWAGQLENRLDKPEHENIRLTSLIMLSALAGAAVRGRNFNGKRLVALLLIATSLAASAAAGYSWARPLLPEAFSGMVALVVKAVMALLAGAFLDTVLGFEPKAVLKGPESNDA